MFMSFCLVFNTNYISIFSPQSIQSILANVAKADHAIYLMLWPSFVIHTNAG